MKKRNVLTTIKYIILFIAAIAILLSEKLIAEEYLFWIILSVLVIAITLEIILDSKIKKIDKEQDKIDKENTRKLVIEKLEALKDTNECYYTMYMLITNQCIELNSLITKANLEINCDYLEEDNTIEIDINSTSIRSKLYYSTALYNDGATMYLVLSEDSDEIKLTNQTYNDIVELIANDINSYYKTLTNDTFMDKLERKANKNNK